MKVTKPILLEHTEHKKAKESLSYKRRDELEEEIKQLKIKLNKTPSSQSLDECMETLCDCVKHIKKITHDTEVSRLSFILEHLLDIDEATHKISAILEGEKNLDINQES